MPKQPIQNETTQLHKGFGKVILFGEHVVVHGAPAIVAGVAEYTDCRLKVLKGKSGLEVIDNRPAVPGYKKNKRDEQKLSHDLVLKYHDIDLSSYGLQLTLGGPLVPSSGIGASASDVVSLSRALNEMYGLNLSEEQVNMSAFEGEKGYHGTPSGVDNTAATFGGLISYKRTKEGPLFAPITTPKPLTMYLVVVSTGITASTTSVVGEVRQMKEKNPNWWNNKIMGPYNNILEKAGKAMRNGDLALLGQALDDNHAVCQDLTVSCTELDDIVLQSRKYGALGAKMSGTGRGGIAVALCGDEASQKAVAEGLRKTCKYAKFVWLYSVNTTSSSKL